MMKNIIERLHPNKKDIEHISKGIQRDISSEKMNFSSSSMSYIKVTQKTGREIEQKFLTITIIILIKMVELNSFMNKTLLLKNCA